MSEKIDIPEGVVNRNAYIKYYVLKKNPILRDIIVSTSDGKEINLSTLPHWFRRDIQHLPPKEQEYLMERRKKYTSWRSKCNALKIQAYGKVGRKKKVKGEEVEMSYEEKADVALEHDIVTLLGRMFSINEVVRILAEDNGIVASPSKVKEIMARNLVAIERAREEFRNKVTDVRLYNKRPRLEELAWMYSKMKLRYLAMNSTEAYNAMLRTLEQIRKESEGDILNINGALDVNLSVELQAHVQKDILKTINMKEIILGRIAARMNYDCTKLIAGLHNSYYNQFVQISGDYTEDAEMKYPSLVNYDFAEIEHRNEQVNDVVDVEAEEIKEEEHNKANSIKDLFLRKIREQKNQYEMRTSTSVVEEKTFDATDDVDELKRNGRNMRYDRLPNGEKRKEYTFTEESKERQVESARRREAMKREQRNKNKDVDDETED
jgi:hypothetical protein